MATIIMARNFGATSQCSICGSVAYLDGIEPHPRRDDLEFRSFTCRECGPIKTILMRKVALDSISSRRRPLSRTG